MIVTAINHTRMTTEMRIQLYPQVLDSDDDNDFEKNIDNIIVTDDDDTNLEHSVDENDTHSSSDNDVDQDDENKISQDNDYILHPSEILEIDSSSSDNNTPSGAFINDDTTEKYLRTQNIPINLLSNTRPHRPDAGTRVPHLEPSFKGKIYKTTKTRQKQFLTKIKRIMKTGNKKTI